MEKSDNIPDQVMAVVADVIAARYQTHTELRTLFSEHGAPGQPPGGNRVDSAHSWLQRCNDDPEISALEVLGGVLQDFMELEPHQYASTYETIRKQQNRIAKILAKHGLRYRSGGAIEHSSDAVDATPSPSSSPTETQPIWTASLKETKVTGKFNPPQCSILFLDVSGWSKLKAPAVVRYVHDAMPAIKRVLETGKASRVNTWGDAIVATFDSAMQAANTALQIRDHFRKGTELDGIPSGLSCRISLHAGEVLLINNPLTGREDIFGHDVHLAARLEPATNAGAVFSSQPFAELLKANEGLGPRAHERAEVTLPKDFGTIRVFEVTWANEPPTSP